MPFGEFERVQHLFQVALNCFRVEVLHRARISIAGVGEGDSDVQLIALIDNGFRFVSWVLFSCQFQWWNGRTEQALGTVS